MNKAVKDLNRQLNRLIPGGKINHDLLEAYDEHHQAIDHLKREKEIQIRNAEKIYDLIRIVERRKNEIIMRTYKQVNVNFKEIFKQFVPGGVASLQFITRNVDSSMESSSSSSSTTTATTSNGSNETSIRSETITDPSSSNSLSSSSQLSQGIFHSNSSLSSFFLFLCFLFERTIHP